MNLYIAEFFLTLNQGTLYMWIKMKRFICFLFHRAHWKSFPIGGLDGGMRDKQMFVTIGDMTVCEKCYRVFFVPLDEFGKVEKNEKVGD